MSILGLLLLTLIPTAFPLSFDMSPITKSDGDRLNLTGDAYITDKGIQLTTNERGQTSSSSGGRATYTEALHLWNNASHKLSDFTTHFSFVIDSFGSNDFGDGLAFFLAPLGSSIEPWTYGSGLGLVYATVVSSPFVAVEFDTYYNPGLDPYYDGNPHVGIDLNNLSSVVTTKWLTNVTAGCSNDAHISYNSDTKFLTVNFSSTSKNVTRLGSLSHEVDLRDYLPEYVIVGFSAATGDYFENHNVKSWNFSSTDVGSDQEPSPSPEPQVVKDPMPMSKKNKTNQNKKKRLILGLSSGISVFILVLASTYMFCFLLPKKKKKAEAEAEEVHLSDLAMDNEFEKGKRPIKFSYKELVHATNNFAKDRKLGEGGFGSVYRGYLISTNTNVAVKKVSEGSNQGRKEYASEVKIISQLRHINLVELIGWCHQGFELLLVYELMPNGSLDSHLFKPNSVLTWEMRHRVARGLASALLYLHEELAQYVVHRDIKASNIMLDSSFNAKLGDFGLARLVDHDKDMHSTIPAGTIGYMAPEYLATGRASKETDVYSFGVVLLEIACGRMSVSNEFCKNQVRLVEWVWSLYGSGQLLDAADPKAKLDSSEYDARKLERLVVVGLWCVHPESSRRPSIREVLQVLNSEAPLPSLPLAMPKPVYYYNNASREATTSSSSTTYSGGGASSSAGTTSDLVSQTDPTPVFQQPQPFNAAAAAAPSPKKRRRATSCEQCD